MGALSALTTISGGLKSPCRVGKGAHFARRAHRAAVFGGHASLCPPLYGAFCQERCVLPKYFSILWSSFFVRPEGRFSVPTCLGPVTSRADAVKDGRRTDAATRSAF